MAEITEKVFFKGTPSQFCAVMQEYELDSASSGRGVTFEIVEPTEEVILPYPGTGSRSQLNQLLARVQQGASIREKRIVLRPDSPRATLRFSYLGYSDWLTTALLCPGNRTQITVRAHKDDWERAKHEWDLAVGYMDNLGYLEDGDAVSQAKLLEPKHWPEALRELGIARNSQEWWEKIEEWTRAQWERKGRRSLPISGKGITLETITSYERTQIYAKTNLGDTAE